MHPKHWSKLSLMCSLSNLFSWWSCVQALSITAANGVKWRVLLEMMLKSSLSTWQSINQLIKLQCVTCKLSVMKWNLYGRFTFKPHKFQLYCPSPVGITRITYIQVKPSMSVFLLNSTQIRKGWSNCLCLLLFWNSSLAICSNLFTWMDHYPRGNIETVYLLWESVDKKCNMEVMLNVP